MSQSDAQGGARCFSGSLRSGSGRPFPLKSLASNVSYRPMPARVSRVQCPLEPFLVQCPLEPFSSNVRSRAMPSVVHCRLASHVQVLPRPMSALAQCLLSRSLFFVSLLSLPPSLPLPLALFNSSVFLLDLPTFSTSRSRRRSSLYRSRDRRTVRASTHARPPQ